MKSNFYTARNYEKYLKRHVSLVKKRNDMSVEVVDSGKFIVDVKTGAFGVFDKCGKLVRSSLQ